MTHVVYVSSDDSELLLTVSMTEDRKILFHVYDHNSKFECHAMLTNLCDYITFRLEFFKTYSFEVDSSDDEIPELE